MFLSSRELRILSAKNNVALGCPGRVYSLVKGFSENNTFHPHTKPNHCLVEVFTHLKCQYGGKKNSDDDDIEEHDDEKVENNNDDNDLATIS